MPHWSPLARLPRALQWAIAIFMAAACIAVMGVIPVLALFDWRWLPVFVPAFFVFPALEGTLMAPLYTLAGRFRYYSPMLLATRRPGGGLDLHGGTLFDYVTQLRWRDRGPRAARIVSSEMLRGLLAVCAEVERGELAPDAPVTATSYFFSNRSLARLGFTVHDPPAAVRFNLQLAIVGIALRLSFTRGRIAFPDLRRIRQARTTAGALQARALEIQGLLERPQRP